MSAVGGGDMVVMENDEQCIPNYCCESSYMIFLSLARSHG